MFAASVPAKSLPCYGEPQALRRPGPDNVALALSAAKNLSLLSHALTQFPTRMRPPSRYRAWAIAFSPLLAQYFVMASRRLGQCIYNGVHGHATAAPAANPQACSAYGAGMFETSTI